MLLRMKIIHTDHFHRDPKKRKKTAVKGRRQLKSRVCLGPFSRPLADPTRSVCRTATAFGFLGPCHCIESGLLASHSALFLLF